MQDHAIMHLFAVKLTVLDPVAKILWTMIAQVQAFMQLSQVKSEMLCSFCGLNNDYSVRIEKPKVVVCVSDFPDAHKFSLKLAKYSTMSRPSTNRPLIYTLYDTTVSPGWACQPKEESANESSLSYIHWSYNMEVHLMGKQAGQDITEVLRGNLW